MVCFFILISLVPLFFMPRNFFDGFGLPQTLALGTLSTTGIVVGVLMGGIMPLGIPTTLSFIFLICLIMSLMKSDPFHNGLKEFGLQFFLILLFIFTITFLQEKDVKWVTLSSAVTVLVTSVYAFAQTLGYDPLFPNSLKAGGPVTNAIGTIGNPNFLASFICSTVWLVIYSSSVFHVSFLAASCFLVFVLWKTGSRAGLLGFLGSSWFFVLVCAYYEKLPLSFNRWFFETGVSLTILGFLFAIMFLEKYWDTFFYKPIDPKGPQVWYASFRYRICYWIVALRMISRKPLFGWGLWAFRKEIYSAQATINDKDPRFLDPKRYLTPQPREVHNDFLEHVVEYGLFGFIIFIGFIASLYYYSFRSLAVFTGQEFFLLLFLVSGLTAILIDAVFFFALRLPATAIMFWLISGMIVVKCWPVNGFAFDSNILAAVVLLLGFGFVLWECIIKRAISSHYFIRSNLSKNYEEKLDLLMKSIKYAPYDTIQRTHAFMMLKDHYPFIANAHIWKMVEYYDGMTPLHVTLFNAGLAIARSTSTVFDHAEAFLKNSHFLLPTFKPTLKLLNSKEGVCVRAKYKGGQAIMRVSDEATLWRVRALLGEVEKAGMRIELHNSEMARMGEQGKNFELQRQLAMSNVKETLLMEKKRLNIPDHWPFDAEKGEFLDPDHMTEEQKKKFGMG